MPGRCFIAWRSRLTGMVGAGSQELVSRASVRAFVDRMNRDYPEIEHWLESVASTNDEKEEPIGV